MPPARNYRRKEVTLEDEGDTIAALHGEKESRERSRSRSPERDDDGGAQERERRRLQRKQERTVNQAMTAVNEVVSGRVTSVKPFGLFVRLLNSNREGLCHISEVSAQRTSAEALRDDYPVGKEVAVKVLSVAEGAEGKISLSIRQAGGRVAEKPPVLFSIHSAKVVSAIDTAIFVRLGASEACPSGWDAMVHASQLEPTKLAPVSRLLDAYPRGSMGLEASSP